MIYSNSDSLRKFWFNTSTFVSAPMIYSNSDSLRKFWFNTSTLKLFQSESTTELYFRVVLLCWAMNQRSQSTQCRSRSDSSSFLLPFISTYFLLDGLLKPSLHSTSPLLVEMLVWYNIVVSHHPASKFS